jgi:Hydrolytic ATP binding site of dynein motor region
MGRIFIGLAKSGAWGCFDEFNRLDENTLSTVSTLIQAIQLSLKNKQQTVNLLGSEVRENDLLGINKFLAESAVQLFSYRTIVCVRKFASRYLRPTGS